MENKRFQTRADYQEALKALCAPLEKYYSSGNALVYIGHNAAHYGERTTGLEGFARILWGLVPLWMGGENSVLDAKVASGIASGTNPNGSEYWGEFPDGAQAYVEMAVFGFGLLLAPDRIWTPLSKEEKVNFNQWLLQINTHKISDNNWLFFRVLVNLGLKRMGGEYSQERLSTDLDRIDEFYLGDGWYSDGCTKQRDYYIGFALHFYSLIYAGVMKEEEPERTKKYMDRAKEFAHSFLYWFGERGEALPFGRSLTYRFAQGSFWAALAFAGAEDMQWGIIKGVLNRHMRYWFSNPILDYEDKLTLGYTYPNLTVCEGYNSSNSPYWAFKSFLILAIPEDHPFWSATEEPLPLLREVSLLEHPGMLIQRGQNGYVTALTAGQYAEWEPVHCAEKYGKFAYSSYFGFQTPRSYYNLAQAACDNMLAFYKDHYYHVRRRCKKVVMEGNQIITEWSPLTGVEVTTTVTPFGEGHIRKHIICAEEPITAMEGGFSLPYSEIEEVQVVMEETMASLKGPKGESRICIHLGTGKAKYVQCEANVNLLHPRTMLPYLEYEIAKGITEIEVYVEGMAPKEESY